MIEPTIPDGLELQVAAIIADLKELVPGTPVFRENIKRRGVHEKKILPVMKYLTYNRYLVVDANGEGWSTPRPLSTTISTPACDLALTEEDPETTYQKIKTIIQEAPPGKGWVAIFFLQWSRIHGLTFASRLVTEGLLEVVRPNQEWRKKSSRETENENLGRIDSGESGDDNGLDVPTDEEPEQGGDTEEMKKTEKIETRLQQDIPTDYNKAFFAIRERIKKLRPGSTLTIEWFTGRSPRHGASIAQELTRDQILAYNQRRGGWIVLDHHPITTTIISHGSRSPQVNTTSVKKVTKSSCHLCGSLAKTGHGFCPKHSTAFYNRRHSLKQTGAVKPEEIEIFVAWYKARPISNATKNRSEQKKSVATIPLARLTHKSATKTIKPKPASVIADTILVLNDMINTISDVATKLKTIRDALPEDNAKEIRELRDYVAELRAALKLERNQRTAAEKKLTKAARLFK